MRADAETAHDTSLLDPNLLRLAHSQLTAQLSNVMPTFMYCAFGL